MKERLLTPKEAARMLGVHPLTLYRWARKGKIKVVTTPSGRYRYPLTEILRILGKDESEIDQVTRTVIYVRVPSEKYIRSKMVDKQIDELKKFAKKKNLDIQEIIIDISHGFCEETSGLKRLIELAQEKKIGKVLVYSPDSLSRICYWLFEKIFGMFGIEIISIHKKAKETSEVLYMELLDLITEVLQKSER